MLSSYFSLNTVVELICFITAVICLRKDKHIAWRLMILLLFVTYFGETFARFIYMNKYAENNHWVYNILIVFQATIMHYMFAHLFGKYSISKAIIYVGGLLLILRYSYHLINQGFLVYSFQSYALLQILIIIYGFIYYYYLLTDDGFLDTKTYPPFWWVTGILLFSFGSIACSLFDEKLQATIGGHHLTYYVFRVINVILYSFWSFAFICRKWLYKPQQLTL